MDTNTIITAVMQQFITSIADEVIRRLDARNEAKAVLDDDTGLAHRVLHLLETDTLIREEVLTICEQKFNEIDSRLDDVEGTDNKIDSDDSDFADAVRTVIRESL